MIGIRKSALKSSQIRMATFSKEDKNIWYVLYDAGGGNDHILTVTGGKVSAVETFPRLQAVETFVKRYVTERNPEDAHPFFG